MSQEISIKEKALFWSCLIGFAIVMGLVFIFIQSHVIDRLSTLKTCDDFHQYQKNNFLYSLAYMTDIHGQIFRATWEIVNLC